jgi:hypothetical protein
MSQKRKRQDSVGGDGLHAATYHKPVLFFTMTCNPFWPEISRAIPAGSHWRFHPDIVGRVFMLKFAAVLHDITVSHIFGPVLAYVWRVEWQVRSSMR